MPTFIGTDRNERISPTRLSAFVEEDPQFSFPSDLPDLVRSFGGIDRIETIGGDDTIFAGDGNDRVEAGLGDDYVNGGDGDDRLDASDGDDYIVGGAGNDVIFPGAGNDFANAGAGNDTFLFFSEPTLAGADTLLGGSGDDRFTLDVIHDGSIMRGGQDNDIFIISDISQDVTLEGGAGRDLLSIRDRSFEATENAPRFLAIDMDEQTIAGAAFDFSGFEIIEVDFGVVGLFGTSRADHVIIENGGTFDLRGGNDIFDGNTNGIQPINVRGGAGNDLILMDGNTDNEAYGGTGADTIEGSGRIFGGGGDDSLKGSVLLKGNGGDDTLEAFGGDTTLDGGTGDNLLIGSATTSDIFEFRTFGTGTHATTIRNFDGASDEINFTIVRALDGTFIGTGNKADSNNDGVITSADNGWSLSGSDLTFTGLNATLTLEGITQLALDDIA